MEENELRDALVRLMTQGSQLFAYTRSRVVARRCGAECVEDVFQESMLSCARSLPTFRGTTMSSLVVWCRIIIDHRAADHHKRCQRRPLSFTDISPTGSVDLPAQASEQEDDRIEQIHAALLELPASQAEAFRMRHFVGWHYARIAAIQRCTVKTARWRVFRARRRLAARFRIDPESLGDEPDSP